MAIIRKAVVFEEIRNYHIPLLIWYLWRRCKVCYLRPNVVMEERGWFHKLRNTERIHRLFVKETVSGDHNASVEMAINTIDEVYNIKFHNNPVVMRMNRLYRSNDIHLAFKKSLCGMLASYYYYVLLVKSIGHILVDHPDWEFIPLCHRKHFMDPWWVAISWERMTSHNKEKIWTRIPWWLKVVGWLSLLAKGARSCLVSLHLLGLAALGIFQSRRQITSPQRFDFAVSIIAPQRQLANQVQGVDFLLDGKRIRKDNTLFVPIAKISHDQGALLQKRGLVVADLGVPPARSASWRVLGHGLLLVVRAPMMPEWMFRTATYLLKDYWLWSGFVQKYKIGKFVTYCDYWFRHIGRNIILRQEGTTTWHYADTENTPDAFATKLDGSPYLLENRVYLLYDYFISWGMRFNRLHQIHNRRIGQYLVVGCLWSEHVRLIKEGKIPSDLPERLRAAGYSLNLKMVAVFDSTYVDASVTTYQDGIAFLEGIRKLLSDRPDILIVWKEKKPRWIHRDKKYAALLGDSQGLEQLYEQLAVHPRCFFPGYQTNSSEVLALCGLAISFPFTSTTLEALGAGIKAIYYDPANKYRGSFYDRAPGLVAHGYDELKERVEKLLYHTTAEEYRAYLQTHIKGYIDPYLDGCGLTRFRDLLCGDGERPAFSGKRGPMGDVPGSLSAAR